MPNALAHAISPYLLQHQGNPVDWREWNEESLALARDTDRPILLSIGYAACHWCHVMAHESFEDPLIASLINRRFVPIKVDREERPDLDAVYQQSLALLGQQGGWPLTMFLTPGGEPFWGGTYFPPEPRWGRPSFREVLEQVARSWEGERGKVEANRDALRAGLARLGRTQPGPPIDVREILEAGRSLAEDLDPVHGGLGGAPKFPHAPVLAFLWQVALLADDRPLRQRLVHTLARICQGGIYDHLGGGFARYSVDAFWLVPHFEKMLYDNAQLLELLGEAWAAERNPLFAARAGETVAWLEREMGTEGGFAASLDADSDGAEGRFYVWDRDEIRSLLGGDAPLFEAAYGVTRGGNWEHTNILHRLHAPGLAEPEVEAVLQRCRATLLAARTRRVAPARDDKVLADWNGLAIAALARAGLRLAQPAWIALARQSFARVCARLGEGDRLVHCWRSGRRTDLGFLDDYAQLARAALALHEACGEEALLRQAEAWMDRVFAEFGDAAGELFATPHRPDLPVRPKAVHDGPTPSPLGTVALESARLWSLTGQRRHLERAQSLIESVASEARLHPFAHATTLAAALLLARPIRIDLHGAPDDPALQALRDTAARTSLPARVLVHAAPAGGGPAAGSAGQRAAAQVCVGTICLAPVHAAADLRAQLADAARLEDRGAPPSC